MALWEKNKEFWLRARGKMRIEKEKKHAAKSRRRQESEDRWKEYYANPLRMRFCEDQLKELYQNEIMSGS
jgi:hypothetical protein